MNVNKTGINAFPNRCALGLPKNTQTYFLPASANLPPCQKLTQSLASNSAIGLILCKILPVFNIALTVDFLFLLKTVALPFTYPLLNLFLLKPLSSAGKKRLSKV